MKFSEEQEKEKPKKKIKNKTDLGIYRETAKIIPEELAVTFLMKSKK